MSPDERAIRQMIDAWMAATKAGDIDKVLSLMTDDVVFMTPGRPPFGKKEFAENSRGMAGQVTFDGRAEPLEVVVNGDWGYTRVKLDITVTPKDGEAKKRAGFAMSIVRKASDGRWQIARDANLVT